MTFFNFVFYLNFELHIFQLKTSTRNRSPFLSLNHSNLLVRRLQEFWQVHSMRCSSRSFKSVAATQYTCSHKLRVTMFNCSSLATFALGVPSGKHLDWPTGRISIITMPTNSNPNLITYFSNKPFRISYLAKLSIGSRAL